MSIAVKDQVKRRTKEEQGTGVADEPLKKTSLISQLQGITCALLHL